MIKFLSTIRRDIRGSALLVALLVMGVLMAISLALSALIFSETRSTKELVDSGRAYYAAESGIEEALYYLDASLPGWEGDDSNPGKIGDRAVFAYEVDNKCNAYPCFDVDEYVLPLDPYVYYDVLELNENITIPLFTVDEEGNVDSVKDFTVEFFVAFDPKKDLKFDDPSSISGWDVLRWKVFGLRNTPEGYVTEALHDFTAVSALNNLRTGEDTISNAATPSWFGTRKCDGGDGDGIDCREYQEPIFGSTCTNFTARDYYLYDNGSDEFVAKYDCYPISDFMLRNSAEVGGGSTGLNYLSLTNLMNPAMLSDDISDKLSASRIYFRVETYEKDTQKEYASIVSDGYSGDMKQSISVEMKRDSYMPVFNFSIYSTYGSEEGFYAPYNQPQVPG